MCVCVGVCDNLKTVGENLLIPKYLASINKLT